MGRKQMSKTKIFSVVLDAKDWEALHKKSMDEQISISAILRRLVRNFLAIEQ